jgi:hypothetical protein
MKFKKYIAFKFRFISYVKSYFEFLGFILLF